MSEEKKTVPELLKEVAEKMCDKYCKYPELCSRECGDGLEAEEVLWEKYCDNCPIGLLT